jgi:hypothetical protein
MNKYKTGDLVYLLPSYLKSSSFINGAEANKGSKTLAVQNKYKLTVSRIIGDKLEFLIHNNPGVVLGTGEWCNVDPKDVSYFNKKSTFIIRSKHGTVL